MRLIRCSISENHLRLMSLNYPRKTNFFLFFVPLQLSHHIAYRFKTLTFTFSRQFVHCKSITAANSLSPTQWIIWMKVAIDTGKCVYIYIYIMLLINRAYIKSSSGRKYSIKHWYMYHPCTSNKINAYFKGTTNMT